ncbi:MAG: GH32 C-terminal domain-containing protein [Clostridia bacterium]|nr:GH32 C-terminal domain-containing protein [Clostridia bacterium]
MSKADKFLSSKVANTAYFPIYHLAPPYGWMNDPNGFCYYRDEWHLFYQYNPYAARWGRMHWGHAKSKDLCCWEHLPVALSPDSRGNDNFLGCFSGSAIDKDGSLYLMYTGVPFLKQHQMLAKSIDGLVFEKLPQPVIPIENRPPKAARFAFRDPKIIVKDGCYYSVIGASCGKGRQVALYESRDLIQWNYRGSLKTEEKSKGIFECPDLVFTKNGDILIYSVMYTKTNGLDCQNIHSCFYEIGYADVKTSTFRAVTEAKELDKGADFYAPQTTVGADGRVVMVAWMQMWMRSIPTAYLGHGFAGMMTLPRELEVRGNTLTQKPIREVYELFGEGRHTEFNIKDEKEIAGFCGSVFLLKMKLKYTDGLLLKLRKGEECHTDILFDHGKITFNRENSGYPIKGRALDGNCNVRQMYVEPCDLLEVEIFSDSSSIELFINNKQCMSNTVYPYADAEGITFASQQGALVSTSFHPYKG